METKIIDLRKIREQLVANCYNLLQDKGYVPEDGINVLNGLYGNDADEWDAPRLLVTGSYSLNYNDDITAYPIGIAYITFFNDGTEFEVYEDDPDEDASANYATDKDFTIESLSELYGILEDIKDKEV